MTTNRQNPTELVVNLRDVHKTYRRGQDCCAVLAGTDFHVRRGEFVILMGPSGCGKTTLLSIVGGVLQADCGRVEVLGMKLSELDEQRRTLFRREHLGFIFQRFHLLRGLSAIDNVVVPMSLAGCPETEARRRAGELLERVGLSDKADSPVDRLSAGQCQRIAIARALAGDPDIILADEPTASLDAENGQSVIRLLRELTIIGGRSVVVVTHDDRIARFADRVCHMRDGRLHDATSAPSELLVASA